MGLFSRFENKVEDGFDGMNDKLFDSPISPVQICKKAEKQMKREKMVGSGKEYAPTLYTVLVNPDDDDRLFGYYPTLAGETETYLMGKAQESGLLMDGQPLVRFIVDDGLKHGKFDIIAELVSAPIIAQLRQEEIERYGLVPQAAPAPEFNDGYAGAEYGGGRPSNNYASSGVDVMSEDAYYGEDAYAAQNDMPQTTVFTPQSAQGGRPNATPHITNLNTGRSQALKGSNTLIGRAVSCDIVLDDLNVSRTHAEIIHEGASLWTISDLGSTNGTLVNGRHVASAPLNEGDRITLGTTTLLFTFN